MKTITEALKESAAREAQYRCRCYIVVCCNYSTLGFCTPALNTHYNFVFVVTGRTHDDHHRGTQGVGRSGGAV